MNGRSFWLVPKSWAGRKGEEKTLLELGKGKEAV